MNFNPGLLIDSNNHTTLVICLCHTMNNQVSSTHTNTALVLAIPQHTQLKLSCALCNQRDSKKCTKFNNPNIPQLKMIYDFTSSLQNSIHWEEEDDSKVCPHHSSVIQTVFFYQNVTKCEYKSMY